MKLALGTVQLGLSYGVANTSGKPSKREALTILKKAVEGGIRLFDTAAGYNDSESIIGEFVKEAEGNVEFCIATKTGSLFKRGVLSLDLQDVLEQDIKSSLTNLHAKEIDYYMLHNTEDLFHYGEDIVKALSHYKQKGIIKKIGVSVYSPNDVQEVLQYKEFEQIQVPFNILDGRLLQNGWMEKIKSQSIEVHGRSIYLQGLITMSTEAIPQKLAEAKKPIQQLDEMAKAFGLTRKELAYLYVRDCEQIDKMIIGCETQEQLNENMALYKKAPLPKEVYQQALAYFSEVPVRIINPVLW